MTPLRDCLAAAEIDLRRLLEPTTPPVLLLQSRFGLDFLAGEETAAFDDPWPTDRIAGLGRLPGLGHGQLTRFDWLETSILGFEWEQVPGEPVHASVQAFMVWLAARLEIPFFVHLSAGLDLREDASLPGVHCVADHVRWDGEDPLSGWPAEREGVRFPQMAQSYDPTINRLLADRPDEGRLAWVRSGPSGATEAELAVFRRLGGELLVESGAAESIAARHCGRRFASLILTLDQASEGPPDPGRLAARAEEGLPLVTASLERLVRGLDALDLEDPV